MGKGQTLVSPPEEPEVDKATVLKRMLAERDLLKARIDDDKEALDTLVEEILVLLGDEKEILPLDDGTRLRVTPVRPEKTIYHLEKIPPAIAEKVVVATTVPETVQYAVDEEEVLRLLKAGEITSEQLAEFVEFKPIKPSIRVSVPKDEDEDDVLATVHQLKAAASSVVLEEEDD